MNLDKINGQDKNSNLMDDMEFDFKPITSGLGFHHQKATEVKPTFTERTTIVSPVSAEQTTKKDLNVYQNDLSLFYGQANPENAPEHESIKAVEEIYYRLASKPQRLFAYLTDLLLVISILSIVLTVMARTISMDLIEVWQLYPNEITPLVLTLFAGFYIIYFSIFEKATQSTLGKNLFGLRVVTAKNNKHLSLSALILRSGVSLLNFVSLGLFSYFDLQSKVSSSKVIRID